MSFRIALNFEDGVTRFITCAPGETVAEATIRQGVRIPLDCREGACGTCKSFCESGRFLLSDYLTDALSDDERAEGFVLPCKLRPKSDCVLIIPAAFSTSGPGAEDREVVATISALDLLSPTVIRLVLTGPVVAALDFLPGQYARIFIPDSVESRAYSFSSLARDGHVKFLIKNIPQGKMSGRLARSAKIGDELRFTAPYGSFYLRKVERPLLFIAGGTGLGPFLAMLETLENNKTALPVRLVYGVNTDEDLVELALLAKFKETLPDFTFVACVASSADAGRVRGVVTDHLPPKEFFELNADVYACGPPPMIAAVEAYFRAYDIKCANLYYEKFLPNV
ncbi:MAG: 2Fe-2S iron-sulfur cluster binding domain-containing protein [Alphaproteobacteria bacterium]|nr:2Fe-2S iron-sulfur cluster binding domain-containing protein [Alphaproteobacteria bacterium]